MHRVRQFILPSLLAAGLLAATPAFGQYQRRDADDLDGAFKNRVLEAARANSGITEKLGDQVPRDLTFTNSDGQSVTIGDVLDEGRPVVLQMAYYRCPALCGEVMNGMVRAMTQLGEDYEIGEDFEVLTISFDSREPPELARDNKRATVEVMGRTLDEAAVEAGWGFWVGEDLSIQRLTEAIGFDFVWVPEAQEYSHPGSLVLLTPEGKVSRYLHGPSFDPQVLRLSLVDASDGKLQPTLRDAFIAYCFDYDPTTGKYTATAMTVMKIGGAVTVFTLMGVIGLLIWAERRGKFRRATGENATVPGYEAPGPAKQPAKSPAGAFDRPA